MNTSPRGSRILLLVVLALCGVGGWISGQLVKRQADLWSTSGAGSGVFGRVCRATEGFGLNCGIAEKTPWSNVTIPLPVPSTDFSVHMHKTVVPVAFLGLAYFVFMATWFVFVGRPRVRGGWWRRIPLVVGGLGTVVSVFYLVVMVAGWAPVCTWCVLVHGVNLLMVLSMRRLYRRCGAAHSATASTAELPSAWGETTAGMIPASRQAVCAVVFALIFIGGLWFYRHEQLAMGRRLRALVPYKRVVMSLRADPAFLLREHNAQSRQPIPLRSCEHPAAGQLHLVVFTDFECSPCSCNAAWLGKHVLPMFDGQLDVEVRHYPLCNECNPAAAGLAHPNACTAAYAAEAARLQDGADAYRKMHEMLYANRKRLGPETYRKLAQQIGLNVEQFVLDLEGDTVRRVVRDDIALARELGVDGAPTMFLNGRRITAFGRNNPVFWQAVAQPGRN
ncbi:MAG: DsbA family protein [Phycisphaerae bacterium]|nr:DsbA family protein [Phycisphaerae bacterium]